MGPSGLRPQRPLWRRRGLARGDVDHGRPAGFHDRRRPRALKGGERDPAPRLRGAGAGSDEALLRRVALLEEKLRDLEAQLIGERERTKPMVEAYEQAVSSGALSTDGSQVLPDGSTMALAGDALGGPMHAEKLARGLGLDASRVDDFGRSYEQFVAKIKVLEKAHATVRRDGDTTTLTIEPFGPAGEQLRQEWDDYVAQALSSEEREQYETRAVRNQLLGNRAGDGTRTIRIKEAGGSIQIDDEWEGGDGAQTNQVVQGPAAARDLILSDYAHLLE